MTFMQAFEKIKARLENEAKIPSDAGDFAIQVELTNKDCSGIFYIKNSGGTLVAEPYDYYDNDAAISLSYLSFSKLTDGRLNPSEAAEKGVITISGDASKVNAICAVLPEQKTEKKQKPKKSGD